MRKRATIRNVIVLFVALSAAPAFAEDTSYYSKCLNLYMVNCHQNYNMDPAIVKKCMELGWDAPSTCRVNEGVSAGINLSGTTGAVMGSVSGPTESAGKVGAAPSANLSAIRRSMGSQGWPSVPLPGGSNGISGCTLPGGFDICKLAVALGKKLIPVPPTPTPNDPCPVKNNTAGTYGVKTTLSNAQAAQFSVPCGGAIPLTSYQVTLNKNPTAVAATEDNAFYLWLYQQSQTNGPFNLTGNALKLPTVLCKQPIDPVTGVGMVDANGAAILVKSIDLTTPIGQMITYNAQSMPSLVIRLKSRDSLDLTKFPQPIPSYDPTVPEKYLVIPMQNGTPSIPPDPTNLADLAYAADQTTVPLKGCALESRYYKTLVDSNASADLMIESTGDSTCEGTADQCAVAKTTTTTTTPVTTTCPTTSFTPPTAACTGQTQNVVYDHLNLVLPPAAQTTLLPLTGRSAVMVATTAGSKIYMPDNTILHMDNTAPVFVMTEGGTITLSDNTLLVMGSNASIDPSTGQITLPSGGSHTQSAGQLIEKLASGKIFQSSEKVITVSAKRTITMPAGYMIPTMAATTTTPIQQPYVQIPAK